MPYWITDTLAATPAYAVLHFLVGIPWALLCLPRSEWRRHPQTLAIAIFLGPALVTAWMFILGLTGGIQAEQGLNGHYLTATNITHGVIGLIVVGILGVLWRWRRPQHENVSLPKVPLTRIEIIILMLVLAALIVRWVLIAYWPFTAYDALWVYGYEGRLYTELGYIPNSIGYYPQYLPLQYTYGQVLFGEINDHIARAGLIFQHIGALLAGYVLGDRLFGRRVGLIAMAIWALYPHVGEWSRAGDLEMLVAGLFTLSVAFFLSGWLGHPHARRWAVLSGIIFGIGMWTKPTMGAFVWGVALLAGFELLRTRFNVREAWKRLELILIVGVCCIPLGAVWYLRNILLGLDALVLPPGYWQTLAEQSGVEFGWVILAAIALLLWAWLFFQPSQRVKLALLGGVGLLLLGTVPTILMPARLGLIEWGLILVGLFSLGWGLFQLYRQRVEIQQPLRVFMWVGLLGLPYFITWFFSYSYHYRLSFAIVPLLILPTAYVVTQVIQFVTVTRPAPVWARGALVLGITALSIPGIISAIYDPFMGWDYVWNNSMPNDDARYRSGNAALMNVVDGLVTYQQENPQQPLHVIAPSVDRLPFFFPTETIQVDDVVTEINDLDDAQYFVFGAPETIGMYASIPAHQNPAFGALGRTDLSRRAWGLDDGIFRYEIYELNTQNRFIRPEMNGISTDDILMGDFARYIGYDIGGLELWPGRRVIFHLYFEVLAPAADDYMIFVHLLDANGNLIANWDGPVGESVLGYYSTLHWQAGEYINFERVLQLPDGVAPVGEGYELVAGFYRLSDNMRVAVQTNGVVTGDSFLVDDRIGILPQQP